MTDNLTEAQIPIPLWRITPSSLDVSDNPRGLWPYRQYAKTKLLPRGSSSATTDWPPRASGRPVPAPSATGWKETYRGEYSKKDFPNIERVIKRLWQAGELDVNRVADRSSVDYDPGGWDSEEDFLREAHQLFGRDLPQGQPVIIEVGTEARETASLITSTCHESGVRAYSGGGSSGPGLARKVALRALRRAVENGQDTLLLWLGDFDQAGIRNIVRPHIENVAAFLYGTAGNEQVLAWAAEVRVSQ